MPDNYTLYSQNDYYTIVEVSGMTTPAESINNSALASNGLTKLGKYITLGGALTGVTAISGTSVNTLNFRGVSGQTFDNKGLRILNSARTFGYTLDVQATGNAIITIPSVSAANSTLFVTPNGNIAANRIPFMFNAQGLMNTHGSLAWNNTTTVLTAGNAVNVVGGSINSPGGAGLGISSAGGGTIFLNGSDAGAGANLALGSTAKLSFNSGTIPSGSSPDTGISRSAAGVLQFNTTGTSGQARLVIGGTSITNASTLLDLQSTTRALVLTRNTTEGNITTPVNGMIYYNSTNHKFRGYANGVWVDLH